MNTKEELVARGFRFLGKVGGKDILFSGISGSVSYDPDPSDDVDIFLITRNRRLWITLFRIFIIRLINRDQKICISLVMDQGFAESYFAGNGDYLLASDTIHVIPYTGIDYYRGLISNSPFVQRFFPEKISEYITAPYGRNRTAPGSLEMIFYVVLSSWIILKSLKHNCKLRKEEKFSELFDVVTSPHSFYFDSVKYHELRNIVPNLVADEQ